MPPTLNDQAHAVAVLPNGKVVVAGEFTSANGNPAYAKLVRFNTNGSLDTTFTPPVFNNNLYALGKTSDSKLIVGGFFTDLGGNASIDRIARVFNGEFVPPVVKTTQSANGTVKKLKVGKKKKLPKLTRQGVPEKWKTLTKSKCKIKSGKLVAVKKGTCKLRITAPTTANHLPLSVTVKVKIVK